MTAYSDIKLYDQWRHILMNLILEISSDCLWNGLKLNTSIIQELLDLLRKNKIEHKDLIEYWSVLDE